MSKTKIKNRIGGIIWAVFCIACGLIALKIAPEAAGAKREGFEITPATVLFAFGGFGALIFFKDDLISLGNAALSLWQRIRGKSPEVPK